MVVYIASVKKILNERKYFFFNFPLSGKSTPIRVKCLLIFWKVSINTTPIFYSRAILYVFSCLNHEPSRLLPADDQSFSSDTVTNDNEPNSITTLGTTNNRNNKAHL